MSIIKDVFAEREAFNDYLKKNTTAGEITRKNYLTAISTLHKDGVNPNNLEEINDYLQLNAREGTNYKLYYILKHYLRFLHGKRNKFVKNLLKPIIPPTRKKTIYLNVEQREELISLIKEERFKIIAKIQHSTGMRTYDIMNLKYDTIRFIPDNKGIRAEINVIAKGGKNLTRFLSPALSTELQDFIIKNKGYKNFVFIRPQKQIRSHFQDIKNATLYRYNYVKYYQALRKAVELMGLDYTKFSTHDFRRALIREVYEDTHQLDAAQRAAGHKDPLTTLRYLNTSGLTTKDIQDLRLEKRGI